MWQHKAARTNTCSAFEITSQTDEVMSCFCPQDIWSNIVLSQWTFSSYSGWNTSNKLHWSLIVQCYISICLKRDRYFCRFVRDKERKWVEQAREECVSVEVEIWLTSLHSCLSLWDSSTWLQLNCVPDINKGVSVRADQQLRGSSRGPDWGLSSEGKDLTQNWYKICKGEGHGQRIKDGREELITLKTP